MPHFPGSTAGGHTTLLPTSGKPPEEGFRVIKFKNGGSEKNPPGVAAPEQDSSAEASELAPSKPLAPEAPPAHWLDLVVGLLSACKKASNKMKHRTGIAGYQNALAAKGKSKLRTVGNIVDTHSTDMAGDDTKETA